MKKKGIGRLLEQLKSGSGPKNVGQRESIDRAAEKRIGQITSEQIAAGTRDGQVSKQSLRMYELVCEGKSQVEIAELVAKEFSLAHGIEATSVYVKVDALIKWLNKKYNKDGTPIDKKKS